MSDKPGQEEGRAVSRVGPERLSTSKDRRIGHSPELELAHTAFPRVPVRRPRGHSSSQTGSPALAGLLLLGLGPVGTGDLGRAQDWEVRWRSSCLVGGLQAAGVGWQEERGTEL